MVNGSLALSLPCVSLDVEEARGSPGFPVKSVDSEVEASGKGDRGEV